MRGVSIIDPLELTSTVSSAFLLFLISLLIVLLPFSCPYVFPLSLGIRFLSDFDVSLYFRSFVLLMSLDLGSGIGQVATPFVLSFTHSANDLKPWVFVCS